MSEKKRFVTLFPKCKNSDLVKDVGMIPYIMAKYYNYEAAIVGCDIDLQGDYADEFKKILTLHTLERYSNNDNINGLVYILKNAKRIDVLHIFHFNPKKNALWVSLYKLLNPRGIVYLKLDMRLASIEQLQNHKKCTFGAMRKIDLISAESEIIRNAIENIYQRKIKLIPNGYYDFNEKKKISLKGKEDILITVARLGTYPKATDTLLEAFCMSADRHSWNLRLIGSIEPSFKEYINTFFSKYPEMKERIEFAGEIKDRELLNKEYEKAKVFILPSRFEGFPLVLPEAMKNGCYLILSSKIPPAEELTDNGKYGLIVEPDNIEQLSETIAELCSSDKNWNDTALEIIDKATENYDWINICNKLDKELKSICKESRTL